MQGISYEFIFIVTLVPTFVGINSSGGPELLKITGFEASAGMTLGVRSLILFRDHQFFEVPFNL
jgi:hypothetical protein